MKKKISLFLGVLFLDLTAFLISSTCVSLSWFNKGLNVKFDNQTGKSLANYFASGDGTKDNPYTITESIHFYNFAWLQYLGEFNKNATGSDSVDQKYFKLGKDIDMTGIVVPPVGTVEYPFVGKFDGKGKTINNLTVSNSFIDYEDKHPSVVNASNFELQPINIVGTFGVIGNLSTEFKYDSSINEVTSLYLDNVTLKTKTSNLLVGIFAGYVNGKINDCGVHYSKIEIANGTQYYTTNDGTVNGYIDKKISNYTLLGAYNNTNYYWDGEPGFGTDFGGSIDLFNLNKRVFSINENPNTACNPITDGYYTYKNKDFNLVCVSNIKTNKVTNDVKCKEPYASGNFISLNNGTFLPLNVDLNKITNYNAEPIENNETILSTNTGYIVGGGEDNSTSGLVKIIQYKRGKTNELGNFLLSPEKEKLSESDVAFSYWDSESNTTKRIKDNDNRDVLEVPDSDCLDVNKGTLSRYANVKKDIINLLKGNSKIDTKFASPMLFFNKVDKLEVATIDKAYVCGSDPKLGYEVYKGGINFTLTKAGIVSFVMPTIRDKYNDSEMFNLYSVQRDSNYKITGSSWLFDKLPSTGEQLLRNSVYYCEISLDKGDYFLGATKSTRVPYFMYLDIGASPSTSGEGGTALKNVDFVDVTLENGIKKLNKVDPTNLSKVAFKISGTFDSNYIYYFRRKGNTVYYYSSVPAFGFISPSSTGEKKKASSKACES